LIEKCYSNVRHAFKVSWGIYSLDLFGPWLLDCG
jgi:hypothetical protein